jgi:NAD(P)-dependent dehydrogenase (short-subunit alcohol dehydrogenase family)
LISGMAPGFGVALARTFMTAGYDVLGLSRAPAPEGMAGSDSYRHLTCDATDPSAVAASLAEFAPSIAVWVHNAQTLFIQPFADTAPAQFEAVWRSACLSAATLASVVLLAMAGRGSGAVIFSGATASLRGGARFSAFASAKFALRGFAQALAREYAPLGVHIAHVVIDGLIDAPQTNRRFGPAPAGRIDPGDLAQTYLVLARQPASVWTHELDCRPMAETF